MAVIDFVKYIRVQYNCYPLDFPSECVTENTPLFSLEIDLLAADTNGEGWMDKGAQ